MKAPREQTKTLNGVLKPCYISKLPVSPKFERVLSKNKSRIQPFSDQTLTRKPARDGQITSIYATPQLCYESDVSRIPNAAARPQNINPWFSMLSSETLLSEARRYESERIDGKPMLMDIILECHPTTPSYNNGSAFPVRQEYVFKDLKNLDTYWNHQVAIRRDSDSLYAAQRTITFDTSAIRSTSLWSPYLDGEIPPSSHSLDRLGGGSDAVS
ncbi:hypothetical protein BJ138DRAFT_1121927 [Hygrophoropsis aurantiaca]|uniref:Uncharacterized protein n=1 Tax=Hygrophoropsis aurantiaca TaxID=72124 RepID=A0ACB8ARN9_9AGAM|nr:hypothetical protein BJ138DRAFT_1121927 [Hygrophoropsis aurantiaca]